MSKAISHRMTGVHKPDLSKLPAKQRMFVQYLMEDPDFSVTAAAKRAGYAHPSQMGYKLLRKDPIRKALGLAMKARIDRSNLNADRVLEELGHCALRDPLDLCDEDGKIIVDDLKKIPEGMRRAIDGVKVRKRDIIRDGEFMGQEVIYELKLVPKLGALDLLMKHLGMTSQAAGVNINVDGDVNVLNNYEGVDNDTLIAARQAMFKLQQAKKDAPTVLAADGRRLDED